LKIDLEVPTAFGKLAINSKIKFRYFFAAVRKLPSFAEYDFKLPVRFVPGLGVVQVLYYGNFGLFRLDLA